jgi:hypothetical protein
MCSRLPGRLSVEAGHGSGQLAFAGTSARALVLPWQETRRLPNSSTSTDRGSGCLPSPSTSDVTTARQSHPARVVHRGTYHANRDHARPATTQPARAVPGDRPLRTAA